EAEWTIARLHAHHARFAPEGLVLEIEGKPDRLADRIGALRLKENLRGADVADDPALRERSRPRDYNFPLRLTNCRYKHPRPPLLRSFAKRDATEQPSLLPTPFAPPASISP